MLPPPHQVGTTILGAGEYVVFYLIIMLSGPVALGTIIINQKDFYSLDCIPDGTNQGMNSTLLKPSSAAYVNNQCATEFPLIHSTTFYYILLIGLTFCIFVTIFLLGTSMVPRACLDQLYKEFSEIDSYSASKVVSVMEISTRDEIQVDENTDKRLVSIVRHIHGRAKAGKGLFMIKSTLNIAAITLTVIDLAITFTQQQVMHKRDEQDAQINSSLLCQIQDGLLTVQFACLRNLAADSVLDTILIILAYLVVFYTFIQLIQLVCSFRYLLVMGCCASTRQYADYWAVEEARWLFRTRFGYDYTPEHCEQALGRVSISAGD